MDTIGKGPAILSTCVKRWRFFACKVGFLLQDRTKFGTADLFRQTEHAKAVIRTVLYYRKRGSASYIVREVLSVREREREIQRKTEVTSPLSR